MADAADATLSYDLGPDVSKVQALRLLFRDDETDSIIGRTPGDRFRAHTRSSVRGGSAILSPSFSFSCQLHGKRLFKSVENHLRFPYKERGSRSPCNALEFQTLKA